MQSKSLARGEVLFREGDQPSGLWCISSGVVKLYRRSTEGRLHFIRWALPSEPLGHRSLISSEPHRVTAEAVTPCQVCYLSRNSKSNLLESEPSISVALLKKMQRDLDSAENSLLKATDLDSKQRVASLLLEWENIPHEDMTRKDLAQAAGVRAETFSRILSKFHDQGIIRRSPRRLQVIKPEALEEMLQ